MAGMISVIIPTRNAENFLPELLKSLLKQDTCGHDLEILVVDSSSEDSTKAIALSMAEEVDKQPHKVSKSLQLLDVEVADFDHGGTRNMAWRKAKGEYIFFLTQDALPADDKYVKHMLEMFSDSAIVMVSGRQCPREDANPVERLTREFNYPKESNVRTAADIKRLGIKAYFFSDACGTYRRSFLEEMEGFEAPILTNEDMLMAARALKRGYKVAYAAEARVYHSHNFTLGQQYRRNFDVAVFMTMYANELDCGSATGEGIRMVRFTERQLLKQGKIGAAFRCVFESAAKYLGNRAGKRYSQMSRETILKKTGNKGFWNKAFQKNS